MEKWFFETACFYKAGIKLINEISVRENDNARVQENTEFLNKEWKSTDKNSGMIPIDYCLLFKLRKLYWVLNLQKQCNFLSDAYDLLYKWRSGKTTEVNKRAVRHRSLQQTF